MKDTLFEYDNRFYKKLIVLNEKQEYTEYKSKYTRFCTNYHPVIISNIKIKINHIFKISKCSFGKFKGDF